MSLKQKQNGRVVIAFQRAFMVYKRACVPQVPLPVLRHDDGEQRASDGSMLQREAE